jgi:hypothetical protein
MNKVARRGAQLRLSRPTMREGFSLSGAPATFAPYKKSIFFHFFLFSIKRQASSHPYIGVAF